jgi:dolichol-phosphate mannosyltransferase
MTLGRDLDLTTVEQLEAEQRTGSELRVELSVVLPAYNEAPNLREFIPELRDALLTLGRSFEIIVVDDGSTDDTRLVMSEFTERCADVHCARLRRNVGKSAALTAAFELAGGDFVVLMDADGQDVPAEIPRLVAALDEGFDLVTGRRIVRRDRFVKRATSKLYNGVTARVTGIDGHDFNSGFKAMRREVTRDLDLYGELHRYIPVLAHWAGYRVTEVDVEHRARMHGTSKFGRSRFWRGVLDLVVVKFLTTYNSRPFHLFGGLGIALGTVGAALLTWMGILRIHGDRVGDRPALLIGVLCVVVAVQLLSLGLIASLVIHHRRPPGQPPIAEYR